MLWMVKCVPFLVSQGNQQGNLQRTWHHWMLMWPMSQSHCPVLAAQEPDRRKDYVTISWRTGLVFGFLFKHHPQSILLHFSRAPATGLTLESVPSPGDCLLFFFKKTHTSAMPLCRTGNIFPGEMLVSGELKECLAWLKGSSNAFTAFNV